MHPNFSGVLFQKTILNEGNFPFPRSAIWLKHRTCLLGNANPMGGAAYRIKPGGWNTLFPPNTVSFIIKDERVRGESWRLCIPMCTMLGPKSNNPTRLDCDRVDLLTNHYGANNNIRARGKKLSFLEEIVSMSSFFFLLFPFPLLLFTSNFQENLSAFQISRWIIRCKIFKGMYLFVFIIHEMRNAFKQIYTMKKKKKT